GGLGLGVEGGTAQTVGVAGGELDGPLVEPTRHVGAVGIEQRGEVSDTEGTEPCHAAVLVISVGDRPYAFAEGVEVRPHLPHHVVGHEMGVYVHEPGDAEGLPHTANR